MSRTRMSTRPPRRVLYLSVGALLLCGAGVGATRVAATAIPPVTESAHAATLAQGVIEAGTADHQWVLQAFSAVAAPVEVPAAGPTFVIPSSLPVRVLGEGGAGLGSSVESGEATYVPAGRGHQLSAVAAADVLEVGITGGAGLGTFPLTAGLYDMELVRDVLANGETLTITGVAAGLVLVVGGSVTLPDGSALPAGFNLPFVGATTLSNNSGAQSVVLVATVSPIASPAVAGATPSTAAPDASGTTVPGASTPANATPGATTPASSTPGNSTPGNSTPGNSTPGNSTPGSSTPGNETPTTVSNGGGPATTTASTAPATTPAPTAAPTTTQPPATTQAGEGPLSVQLVSCSGGQTLNIRVDASAGSGYRRNIQSVTVSRQNNEGAYSSPWNLSWIGEDTTDHDEWSTANQVTGQNQNMGDGLRVTARSVGGQTQTINTTLSASC